MKTLNGEKFKMLLISGANHLYNHYPEIDALNVFPVPDGDTGMNMNLTMQSGCKEISNRNDSDIYTIARVFSKGLLMGARGNSGVITSQIFRGIANGMEGKKTIDAIGLSDALISGKEVAYKAVLKPVEGTILTVIREASEALHREVRKDMSIEEAFAILLKEAKESLERTPNLLPVLKEVGVVDSGGAGLITIFEGMESALKGEFIDKNEATALDKKSAASEIDAEGNEEFGYCTEFIIRLGPDSIKKVFQENRFKSVLASHGNSLVVVRDDDIVKVHVHTIAPGNILTYAQNFGEFIKIKVENMTEQHQEILFKESNLDESQKSAAGKLNKAPNAAPKKETKKKEYALIATSSGKGVSEYFKEVGVDEIVSGGQTMNPSTEDFLKKIEEINAKNIFILPNNSNIIMAANQVKEVLKDKMNVEVIPTKTIMQGIASAMSFNPECDIKTNIENMNEAIHSIKSGAVTFAIKDSDINGIHIKKDQFMAIENTKDIIGAYGTKAEALDALVKGLVDEDSAILTILVGEDIDDSEIEKLEDHFSHEYGDLDCDIRRGDQPVYSYLVGVE